MVANDVVMEESTSGQVEVYFKRKSGQWCYLCTVSSETSPAAEKLKKGLEKNGGKWKIKKGGKTVDRSKAS